MPKAKLIVIGMGQELRGDDAIGIEVVKRWQNEYPETARNPELIVELAPLPGLSLLSFLECCQAAILVDAVHSGAPVGSLHVLDRNDLDAFGAGSGSAHGWGVAETLELGETVYAEKMPEHIALLGVESGNLDLGEELSTEVKAALPEAAKKLQEIVQTLLFQTPEVDSSQSKILNGMPTN